jgi:hypothetical protein
MSILLILKAKTKAAVELGLANCHVEFVSKKSGFQKVPAVLNENCVVCHENYVFGLFSNIYSYFRFAKLAWTF